MICNGDMISESAVNILIKIKRMSISLRTRAANEQFILLIMNLFIISRRKLIPTYSAVINLQAKLV